MLEQVKAFLTENPQEFLVLYLNHEHGRKLDSQQKEWIYRRAIQTFQGSAITQHDRDTWFDVKTVTLSDIVGRRKNILVQTCNKLRTLDDGL